MKITFTVALAVFLACVASATAEESAAEFFARDRGQTYVQPSKKKQPLVPHSQAQKVVAEKARRILGEQWVAIALTQAHRESGFNPHAVGPKLSARHGGQRARGIFQVLPNTARGMGYDPARLHELEYGVEVGLAYMARCIKSGVATAAEMNSCFLRGYYSWASNSRGARERRNG